MLYCLARYGYRPGPTLVRSVLLAMGEVAAEGGGGLTAQTASMLLWSLGRMRYRPLSAWTRMLQVNTAQLLQ